MIKDHNRQGSISWRRPLPWILLGFLISYMFFFIRPVFFSPEHRMQFREYVPALNTIGADLERLIDLSRAVLVLKEPLELKKGMCIPLECILYRPLVDIDPYNAYVIATILNIISFLFITVIFPVLISKDRKLSAVLMLVLVTGLFSYGFQFELERGQSNVLAMFLCFLAVYMFHYHHRLRYLAYLLFSVSIQLKLYPGIFVVLFIKDWSDWKGNIKRITGILGFTFACLFILGIDYFVLFYNAIKTYAVNPNVVWKGNFSIRGFISYLSTIEYKLPEWALWITANPALVQTVLLISVIICLLLVMMKAYSLKEGGINPYVLLACTIGALLIPSDSHEYKLSILAGPVAIFLNDVYILNSGARKRLLSILLITIISVFYSSTLFSYVYKPFLLKSNLPVLYVILIACTLFYMIRKPVAD